MTPQALYKAFLDLCPLIETNGVKYQTLDKNTIKIKIPGKPGSFIFEYHNDKDWSFKHKT